MGQRNPEIQQEMGQKRNKPQGKQIKPPVTLEPFPRLLGFVAQPFFHPIPQEIPTRHESGHRSNHTADPDNQKGGPKTQYRPGGDIDNAGSRNREREQHDFERTADERSEHRMNMIKPAHLFKVILYNGKQRPKMAEMPKMDQ